MEIFSDFLGKANNDNKEEIKKNSNVNEINMRATIDKALKELEKYVKYFINCSDSSKRYAIDHTQSIILEFTDESKNPDSYIIKGEVYDMEPSEYTHCRKLVLLQKDGSNYTFNHEYFQDLMFCISRLIESGKKIDTRRLNNLDKVEKIFGFYTEVEGKEYTEKLKMTLSKKYSPIWAAAAGFIANCFDLICDYVPEATTDPEKTGLLIQYQKHAEDEEHDISSNFLSRSTVYYKDKCLYEPNMSASSFIEAISTTDTGWYPQYKKLLAKAKLNQCYAQLYNKLKKIDEYFISGYTDEYFHIEYKQRKTVIKEGFQSIEYVAIYDMKNNGECVFYYDANDSKKSVEKPGDWVFMITKLMDDVTKKTMQIDEKKNDEIAVQRTKTYVPEN